MHRSTVSLLAAHFVALCAAPHLVQAQGRTITAFPYSQSFAFVPSGTSTTPSGPIGAPVFPTTDVDGGEFTVDANTSSSMVNSTTTGLNNNAGAGGMLRIHTSGSSAPTIAQGFIVHASFTGRFAGSISIAWTKVANSTSTRANELRIAASADGDPFTDLVAASFDNSATAQSGTLSTTLPSSLNGVADVRFRIYSINVSGSGSHPRVIVDSLQILADEEHPLPVELAAFTAEYRDGRVAIAWRTASERDNEGFEILRASSSDTLFRPIASYRTHDALRGMGTSAFGRAYSFDDDVPAELLHDGGTVSYRLVDIAPDGTRTEHGVRSVVVAARENAPPPLAVALLRLEPPVPTPATERIAVRWSQTVDGDVALDVLDAAGARVVAPATEHATRGTHERSIDLRGLPDGAYTLRLRADGVMRTQPFVIVR
jgi:hypothetical protein